MTSEQTLPAGTALTNDLNKILALPINIEQLAGARRLVMPSTRWERHTTLLTFEGGGEEGTGEDVTYIVDHHDDISRRVANHLPVMQNAQTIGDLEKVISSLDLSHPEARSTGMANYPRWAIMSAALDLALRQADASLSDLLEREPEPMNWALSLALGDPPDTNRVLAWAKQLPGIGFKLDAGETWDDSVCEALAAHANVEVLDLKAWYPFDEIRLNPDASLYERLVRHFPQVIMEDPSGDTDVAEVLRKAGAPIAFDQPLHEAGDLDKMPLPSTHVNVKPSRLGTFSNLFGLLERAAADALPVYTGGQSELGIGRTHVQTVAAYWCPTAPNDNAPSVFHTADPGDDVPTPPLTVPQGKGFGWVEPLPHGVVEYAPESNTPA